MCIFLEAVLTFCTLTLAYATNSEVVDNLNVRNVKWPCVVLGETTIYLSYFSTLSICIAWYHGLYKYQYIPTSIMIHNLVKNVVLSYQNVYDHKLVNRIRCFGWFVSVDIHDCQWNRSNWHIAIFHLEFVTHSNHQATSLPCIWVQPPPPTHPHTYTHTPNKTHGKW